MMRSSILVAALLALGTVSASAQAIYVGPGYGYGPAYGYGYAAPAYVGAPYIAAPYAAPLIAAPAWGYVAPVPGVAIVPPAYEYGYDYGAVDVVAPGW